MRPLNYLLAIIMMLFVGYSQNFVNPHYSGAIHAQNETKAQKNVKKEKKKRMREQAKNDKASMNRHWDIQTKATRKRMKKHLRETKKNVQRNHR